MLRKLKADKANGILTLEMSKDDFRNIIDSIDNVVEKQQRKLLENLPSEDEVRLKLDDYKALKEDMRKIWEAWI